MKIINLHVKYKLLFTFIFNSST